MANIKEIDYDQMINKASRIASAANDMQRAVKQAFDRITHMSSDWSGASYDQFAIVVNTAVPSLNKLFETSVSDIPHEIVAKAKSYAASTQTTVGASFSENTVLMLPEISKTNKGSKFRFLSDKVSADQAAIKSFFEKAKNAADNAKTISQSLKSDWQSISGDNNIYELIAAFKRINMILDNLSKALDQQISAQEFKISATEAASNAAEKVKDVADDAVDAAKQAAAAATDAINQSVADWKSFFI